MRAWYTFQKQTLEELGWRDGQPGKAPPVPISCKEDADAYAACVRAANEYDRSRKACTDCTPYPDGRGSAPCARHYHDYAPCAGPCLSCCITVSVELHWKDSPWVQ